MRSWGPLLKVRARRRPTVSFCMAVIALLLSLPITGACARELTPQERELVSQLQAELEKTRSDIAEANARDAALAGGLVKALIAVRLEILRTNEALIEQRIHAIEGGAKLTVAVPATNPDPKRAASLNAEIDAQRRKVEEARITASQYSGGLVHALAMSTLATGENTLAMLEQQQIIAKFGLGFPSVESAQSQTAVRAGASPSPAATEKPPLAPELDPMQCLRIQTFDSSVLSSNDVFTELAWKVDVESSCARDVGVRVTFTIYDQDEFELDHATEDVFVRAGDVGKARGKMLVSPPEKARRMARQGATVDVR